MRQCGVVSLSRTSDCDAHPQPTSLIWLFHFHFLIVHACSFEEIPLVVGVGCRFPAVLDRKHAHNGNHWLYCILKQALKIDRQIPAQGQILPRCSEVNNTDRRKGGGVGTMKTHQDTH